MPTRYPAVLLLLFAGSFAAAQDSPLDKLDPKLIPAEERLSWQPKELVAVLGSHRGRHWASVRGLAYSPNGKLLASAGGDDTVRLWDAATLRELAVLSVKKLPRFPQLAFSPDNKTLYAPGHAWDVSGPELKKLDKGPTGPALFTRDGKRMAAFGEEGMKVYAWSPKEIKEVVHIPINFNIKYRLVYEPVGFSPDGRFLAIRRVNGETGSPMDVQLWEIDAAKSEANRRDDLFPDKKMLTLAAMSPDGRWLALADMGGQKFTATLYDLSDKLLKPAAIEPGPEPPTKRKSPLIRPTGVGFSQDSKYLILGTTNYSGGYTWVLEITKDGKVEHRGRLPGIEDEQFAFAMSPDGKTLAGGGTSHAIRLWHWPDKEFSEKEIRQVHPEGVTYEAGAIAWLPDGQTLVSGGSDKKLRFWDLSKSPFVAKELPDWKERVADVVVAAEGKHLAVAGTTGTAIYRKTADGWGEKRWLEYDGTPHLGMAIAPDGAWVAVAGHFYKDTMGGVRYDNNREKECWLWDLKPEKPKRVMTVPDAPALTATPDGKILATGHDQRSISPPPAILWTLKDGIVQKRGRDLGYQGPRHPIAISPDGKRLASWEHQTSSSDGKFKTGVSLWNIDGSKVERLADMEDQTENGRYLLPDASFSPDGKLLAAWTYSDKLVILDTRGGRERFSWQMPRSQPETSFGHRLLRRHVAFAPDGRHLAVSNANGTIYILRVR